ncbi:Trk system potassium transporter TrkA [Variovorax dokdonensis]|uniref:Trk system potassium uptake protein TrkA n=1 Tax=Variovorax dokdonensis TaxID=344883 RepID=A0ABT7NAE6_9BURK|nr:Trk system potassium transporter TrkA [Variovorax dokdonensis]MDM0044860.1 Trk system potassium transporter TrkA [Variovorax dokdonensis]
MKIIILGAGRIGESVAGTLVSERNEITVIDTDPQRLRELEERFELRGVRGSGIEPDVLAEAGARDADMLIACAALDETNLVCCKLAHQLFNVPTRIARVRSPSYRADDALLGKEGFAVDRVICPEESLTRYIGKLVEYPEALQVREFAGGLACLVSVRAVAGAPLVRHSIAELRDRVPDADMRIVAIYRRLLDQPDRFIVCEGSTRIEPGDEVFVLAAREHLKSVLSALHRHQDDTRREVTRIMIAGGGRVGMRLARQLVESGRDIQLKVLERDAQRCVTLASELPSSVLVLHADGTDEDLLDDEGIEQIDLFLALTNDDENNIMASLLAKRLGASRVLALINRRSYADLMHGTQIDIALSPAQTMLGELLTYVRRGDVQAVHSLRRGLAEALEIVARGDRKTSRVVGRSIDEIDLPKGAQFGLIMRGLPDADALADAEPVGEQAAPQVIIPRGNTVIESNDHVVIFIPRKRQVREVEKLFRVSATFF